MPKLVGFSRFADLPEEQIRENIGRRILSGDQGMNRLVEHWRRASMSSRTITQMSRSCGLLKGRMEFRLGSEQRICGPGEVVVIPGGTEHEAWFREDTEVIDFFAPPRDDLLLGGKPAYISED
jgi:quercetin dioxygenase-like cupin family protein